MQSESQQEQAFRLGTSSFIAQHWLTPKDVDVLSRSPVASIEIASPEMWDASNADLSLALVALETAGLEIWSVHAPFGGGRDLSSLDESVRTETLASVERAFALGESLGCRAIVVHPSAEPIEQADRPERVGRARRSLEQVVEIARSHRVTAALEPLPRTCLANSADEVAVLLENLPSKWLGICLDVNHANLTEELPAFIRRFRNRIVTLHVSDNDGLDERHWLPGEGVIDWPGVMGALLEIGYSGPLMYEVGIGDSGMAKRLDELAKNRLWLLSLAKRSGSG